MAAWTPSAPSVRMVPGRKRGFHRPPEPQLEPETKAQWQRAAERLGLSLSELIRQAVNAKLDSKERPKPARKPMVQGQCDRANFHRAGVFCKRCGVVR